MTPEEFDRSLKVLGCQKRVMRSLPVRLTAPEIQERSQAMAGAVLNIYDLDDELALIKDDFKTRRKSYEAIVREHAQTLKRGWEERPVGCGLNKDFARNVVRMFRLDTGEMVEERAISKEERQRELDGVHDPIGPEGEGAGLQ
jgi:hypothetical protein